jgi:hypothetical protein
MARSDRKRRVSRNLPQQNRILVVIEGVVTEKEYIEAVKRSRRLDKEAVKIIVGHTDPIGIVNQAKALIKTSCKGDAYDQVWCVFDVEAKVDQLAQFGLADALDTANRTTGKNKIRCAVSNPCFEIWLLWHDADQTGPIHSATAQKSCLERGITCGKDGKHIRNADDLIAEKYSAAQERATMMDQTHDSDRKTKPEDRNPSSGVYKLISSIYAAFPPRE